MLQKSNVTFSFEPRPTSFSIEYIIFIDVFSAAEIYRTLTKIIFL